MFRHVKETGKKPWSAARVFNPSLRPGRRHFEGYQRINIMRLPSPDSRRAKRRDGLSVLLLLFAKSVSIGFEFAANRPSVSSYCCANCLYDKQIMPRSRFSTEYLADVFGRNSPLSVGHPPFPLSQFLSWTLRQGLNVAILRDN
jgi:hypothetical protein